MTTTDKTGEKLVASIRRTKAAATAKGDPDAAEKSAPGNGAVAENPSAEATAAAPRKNVSRDTYQWAARVWPD